MTWLSYGILYQAAVDYINFLKWIFVLSSLAFSVTMIVLGFINATGNHPKIDKLIHSMFE